jgi:hypothetical protein
MGFSNYKKLENLTKKFNLSAKRQSLFTPKPNLVEPSLWLIETLKLAELVPLRNEKAKSERIVSPILVEIAKNFADKITLFSGDALEVRPQDDLSGECDFFFTLVPQGVYIEAPIISLVEAKDEDMEWGTAQCAAQLYGAKLFNEAEGKNFPFLYGCATDGVEWQFLRFEKDVFYIDTKVYTDLREILGVWHYVIRAFLN